MRIGEFLKVVEMAASVDGKILGHPRLQVQDMVCHTTC